MSGLEADQGPLVVSFPFTEGRGGLTDLPWRISMVMDFWMSSLQAGSAVLMQANQIPALALKILT